MAESAVSFIVDKLGGLLSREAELLLGIGEEVEDIRNELDIMKAFLKSAEEKQQRNPEVNTWIKQVRELAYDAEDCIDEYAFRISGTSHGHGLIDFLHQVWMFLRTIRARHRIAVAIRRIRSEARELGERRIRYGLTPSSSITSTGNILDHVRTQALYVEEAQLEGIEEPKAELLKWLLEGYRPQLSVLSVVGMGGLGKTTLVRKVYDSWHLNKHFHCRAWITISQSSNVRRFLEEMASELIPPSETGMDRIDQMGTVQLNDKLRNYLKDRRYVVVFDDMWNMEAWNGIKNALPDGRKGSRVVVTTRIETVALGCSKLAHDKIYRLKPLTLKKSTELFCKRVFGNDYQSPPSDLEDLTNAILKKCDGLPLAIVTIAAVLAPKPKNKEEWQKVIDSLSSETQKTPEVDAMKQILMLSYNDLPSDLKPCFLYLSVFPEDHEIPRKLVKQLWIAEGLAKGTPERTSKEVAESYLNEFINRSMIQPSNINYLGKMKTCQVHDVLLQFIVSKSSEENVVSLFNPNAIDNDILVRRLSFREMSRISQDQLTANHDMTSRLSRIRSLTVNWCLEDSFSLLSRWRLLRVLNLQPSYDGFTGSSLNYIGELVHLRYLRISIVGVKGGWYDLPNCWGNLRSLEMLDMSMKIKIPAKVGRRLHKLFYIYALGLELDVQGIEGLKALQTIYNIRFRSESMAKELGKLTQIRKLVATDRFKEGVAGLCATISDLSRGLRSLSIRKPKVFSTLFDSKILSLEPIPSLPLELESLWLELRLCRLPSWITSLGRLTKLVLRNTLILWDASAIGVLQSLPNLAHLELSGDETFNNIIQKELCFTGRGFRSLQKLVLRHLYRKESLRFEPGALPNLEVLSLISCYRLSSVVGMEHLQRLQIVFLNKKLDFFLKTEEMVDGFNIALQMLDGATKNHPNRPSVRFC